MTPQNYAHHLCAEVVDRLIALGADHFFIAPGSRSTPMVSAIVRNAAAKKFLGIDERSLGFMALGYGKRAERAGVLVVTSGTAVANLYPAVAEAFMSSVPLLVITADRPFELRDCGANQTIFQSGIFANHVVKSFDLAPPTPQVSEDAIRAIFAQALHACSGVKKGPVHINVQLREPLSNMPHAGEPAWGRNARSLLSTVLTAPRLFAKPCDQLMQSLSEPGIIVVGELLPEHGQLKIIELAERLGWPIFSDISSNLRFHLHEHNVCHYDLKLLNEDFLASIEDRKTIIKFGSRVVSKRFWQWVEKRPATTRLLSIDEVPDRIDQTGRFVHLFVGHLPSFISKTIAMLPLTKRHACVPKADAIDGKVREFLERSLNNEAYFVARMIDRIPESVNLFLSSGMPIRDADQCTFGRAVPIDVFVNRGCSGIDGILSTTAGIAVADRKPTIALIGDVAFLHDTNGLMLLKHSSAPILVIVINNGGGGIFHFLPIAQETDVVTPYLDSPHQVNVALLCEAHQIPHVKMQLPAEFDAAIARFFAERNTMVVEVIIDRDENVRLHQEFYQKIAKLRLL